MKKIRLPIDTKSLYFNINNDNLTGHTPTVASPLKKTFESDKLENILLLQCNEVDITSKNDLLNLLIKHSKTKVIIRKLYLFNKLSVNGKMLDVNCGFGCYIKEEVDESKKQFGRLKLHYPSKLIYEDETVNINNRLIYQTISEKLDNYAFMIKAFEFNEETKTLNFDALIVGERGIPYSKVFINEKGVGNKLNNIFNENADDYDREIISLKKEFGDDVNPFNYLDYFKKLKIKAIGIVGEAIKSKVEIVSFEYPYSLFDFYYYQGDIKKYGILRVTATKNIYFNLSFIQQSFISRNVDDVKIFLVTNIMSAPQLHIIDYEQITNMNWIINSVKYEEN